MKKLYFIITLLFTVLLASCSQEEPVNGETDNSRVSISAELPGDIAATRAQITIPTTHKLRCIIEVWTKSDSPFLKYREEIAVAAGTVPTFDFPLRPGDYTCLMWADFIAADAAVSEVTSVDGVTYTHFEDTYYDTSNLHQLTVKDEFASNLFDTDLCDGFYAKLEVKKNAAAVNESMKLKRPFAKLIVQETDAEKFATLTGLTVSFEMPKTFSVATGEPGAEMLTAKYSKELAPSNETSQKLFGGYLFVPSIGLDLGSVTIKFVTAAGSMNCEVEEGDIKLTRNQRMLASGNLMVGGALEPDPDPEPEPDLELKIGDYFFIDGTWSSELTEENKADCVGIVYAVGAQTGDDISLYGDAFQGKSIKGYVMALKNIVMNSADKLLNVHDVSGRPYFYLHEEQIINGKGKGVLVPTIGLFPSSKPDKTNFTGYSKTKELLGSDLFQSHQEDWNYPALQVFSSWKGAEASNASEWYIPSVAQLYAAAGGCYGVESKSGYPAVEKIEALNTAFENAGAEPFTGNTGKGYYVYTSCLNSQKDGIGPCLVQINKSGSEIAPKEHPANGAQGVIRPFLTIIK